MKKLVSVLLMLALLCGGAAVLAECAHTNATYLDDGYQEQLSLVGHGDGTHTRTFKVFWYYECNDCGETFSRYMEDGEEHEDCVYRNGNVTCNICKLCNNHEFENSVCTVCSYECDHADSTKTDYGTWENAVYTNLGNTMGHYAKYDFAEVYDCNTCGARHSVIIDWGREDEEPHEWVIRPDANLDSCRFCGAKKPCDVHTFNDKGICTVCAYGCEHESATKGDYVMWLNAQYTNVDETYHHVVFDAAEKYTCNDCEYEYYKIIGANSEEDEKHEWFARPDAGLTSCSLCGAKKPCDTHTEGSVVSTTSSTKTYTASAAGHAASYTRTTVYKCSACNWEFTKTETVNEDEAKHSFSGNTCTVCKYTCSAHSYADGVCSVCGHTCAHEGAAHNGRGTSKLVDAVDHLDGTHTRTFEVWHNYECPTCKYVFEKYIEMGEETEEHNFGHDGSKEKCVTCGAKKACATHSDGEILSKTDGDVSYAATAEGHVASFVRTTVYKCSVCGWKFTKEETVTSDQAKHTFANSKCETCGYTCTDHNYVNKVCSICGAGCDHVNSTKHANIEWLNRQHTCLDETYHHVVFDAAEKYTCNDCGYEYHKIIGANSEEDEKHEWFARPDAGLTGCSLCGAKKPCDTHTEGSVVSTTNSIKTYTSSAAGHVASYTRTTVYKCSTCDWEFTKTETVNEDEAKHSFSGNTCTVCNYTCSAHSYADGVCAVCGHTCAHEGAKYNGTGTSKLKSFVDHHDGTHTRTFEVWHNYECPTCKYVYEKYIEMGTETETHEYGQDGTCHVCGAKPACATHTKSSIIKETDGEKTYPVMGIDYTHHTAAFERTTLYNCGVCGWQFSEKQTIIEAPEKHTYVDGVCTVCANVCSHEYAEGVMYCPYCGVQAPTKVQETTVEKALEKLPEETKVALVEVGLDTAEKITEKLTETVVKQGFDEEQVEVIDVTLQVQVTNVETGKEEWVEVTPDNFPTKGLEVTFDPPAGTNVNDYNFVVVHMFTSPDKAGQVEVLTPTVRDGKLVVKFTSLSPVSISWKAKPVDGAALPQTGDDSMLLLWTALLAISTTVLVAKKRSRA